MNLGNQTTEALLEELQRRKLAGAVSVPMYRMVKAVARVFGVPVNELFGFSRLPDVVLARAATWMILVDRGRTTTELAVVFHRTDTCTIRSACNRGRRELQRCPLFAAKVDAARREVAEAAGETKRVEYPVASVTEISAVIFGVTVAEMKSPSQSQAASKARFVAYLILREQGETHKSMGEIYQRRQASVCKAWHQARQLILTDKDFARKAKAVMDALVKSAERKAVGTAA